VQVTETVVYYHSKGGFMTQVANIIFFLITFAPVGLGLAMIHDMEN